MIRATLAAVVLLFTCVQAFAEEGAGQQPVPLGYQELPGRRIEGQPPPPGCIFSRGGIRGPLRDEPDSAPPPPGQPVFDVPEKGSDHPGVAPPPGALEIRAKPGPTYMVHPGGGVERLPDQ